MFVCSMLFNWGLKQESTAKPSKNKAESVSEGGKKPKMRWLRERERDGGEIKKRIDLGSECEYHKVRFGKLLLESFMSLTALIFAVVEISIFILLQIRKL